MTAAEVCRKAADLLREQGWAQGQFRRYGLTSTCGPRCALGALEDAGNDGVAAGEAEHALRTSLGGSILQWNDAPERTAEQVIAAFEETARRLEMQG